MNVIEELQKEEAMMFRLYENALWEYRNNDLIDDCVLDALDVIPKLLAIRFRQTQALESIRVYTYYKHVPYVEPNPQPLVNFAEAVNSRALVGLGREDNDAAKG